MFQSANYLIFLNWSREIFLEYHFFLNVILVDFRSKNIGEVFLIFAGNEFFCAIMYGDGGECGRLFIGVNLAEREAVIK